MSHCHHLRSEEPEEVVPEEDHQMAEGVLVEEAWLEVVGTAPMKALEGAWAVDIGPMMALEGTWVESEGRTRALEAESAHLPLDSAPSQSVSEGCRPQYRSSFDHCKLIQIQQ